MPNEPSPKPATVPLVPEEAFASYADLATAPAYQELMGRMQGRSVQAYQKYRQRYDIAQFPCTITGGIVGPALLYAADFFITQQPPPLFSIACFAPACGTATGTLGHFAFGAKKYKTLSHDILQSWGTLVDYETAIPRAEAPVPEKVRLAIRAFEQNEEKLPPLRQTRFPTVPEEAFATYGKLRQDSTYLELLDNMALKSGDQKKKFNRRFYAAVLPATAVGGFMTQVGYQITHRISTGENSSPQANAFVSGGSTAVLMTLAFLGTGAYRYFRNLRNIRKPTLVIKDNMENGDHAEPVPEKVRFAIRKFEELDRAIPMPASYVEPKIVEPKLRSLDDVVEECLREFAKPPAPKRSRSARRKAQKAAALTRGDG